MHTQSSSPERSSASDPKPKPAAKKNVEDIYQKKTQLEHILLRPDTYVGSVERQSSNLWVLDSENKMVYKQVSFVPGLYKIFDEILVSGYSERALASMRRGERDRSIL